LVYSCLSQTSKTPKQQPNGERKTELGKSEQIAVESVKRTLSQAVD